MHIAEYKSHLHFRPVFVFYKSSIVSVILNEIAFTFYSKNALEKASIADHFIILDYVTQQRLLPYYTV